MGIVVFTVVCILALLGIAFLLLVNVKYEYEDGDRGEVMLSVASASLALCCSVVLLYTLFY